MTPFQVQGSTISPPMNSSSFSKVRSGGMAQRSASLLLGTKWALPSGPSWATGRPATVIVSSSPLSARRRISPMLLRSSFWGIVAMPPR